MKINGVYSYNEYSKGCKELSKALNVKRIKHERSRFKGSPRKTIINWGAGQLSPEINKCLVLNREVGKATNKLSLFNLCKQNKLEEFIPPFTTDINEAVKWIQNGKTVVCRTVLNGHSGAGIVLAAPGNPLALVKAPLYVKYIPKNDEYRVHCFRSRKNEYQVFDVQRKARVVDIPDDKINWKIRNLEGGFIYQRNNIEVPKCVTEAALKVFSITGLDFGAVDVIYTKKGKAYVLEINTAPGLAGTTLENYVAMFNAM